MSTADVFRRITQALDRAGIAYMLTGSFASAHYGATRSTQDVDFVIDANAEQVRGFVESLSIDRYYVDVDAALESLRRMSLFNVVDMVTGWKIDFIFRKCRPFSEEEFRRRQAVEWHGLHLFLATAEDVIVSKLEWARMGKSQRQIEDVTTLLRMRRDSLDVHYIEKWVSQLSLNEQWQIAKQAATAFE
jgi:hypothetical protein